MLAQQMCMCSNAMLLKQLAAALPAGWVHQGAVQPGVPSTRRCVPSPQDVKIAGVLLPARSVQHPMT
jgi:hypothetical protein